MSLKSDINCAIVILLNYENKKMNESMAHLSSKKQAIEWIGIAGYKGKRKSIADMTAGIAKGVKAHQLQTPYPH